MFHRICSRISSFSVILIFVGLGIFGIALIPSLSIRLYPDDETPDVNVSYFWPDVSARVMEQEVTAKLEGLFSTITGIKSISSVSSKGYARIDLSFKKDANRDALRFEIASLIRQSYPDLPPDVSYPQLSMNSARENTSPLITFAINARESSHFIGEYAGRKIIPLLSRIKGVNEVQLQGVTPYAIEIKFQTEEVEALGITGDDIAKAINIYFKRDLIGKGIFVQAGQTAVTEFTLQLQYGDPDTLLWQKIPIKKVNDRILSLTDLAEISFKEQEPLSYYRINGLNTVNILVYPEKGVNHIIVGKLIREEIRRIRQNLRPGYSLIVDSDSTKYLMEEINNIIVRTLLFLSIVLAFIFIVSRQFGYLLLIVICVVANLAVASVLFYILKIEMQLYSLSGLTVSLGIIVGNSVVMIGHIRNTGNKSVLEAIFASTLTTIIGLGVVFFLPEHQKLNLVELAGVIIINLLISFTIALFLVPALLEKIKIRRRKSALWGKRTIIRLTGVYEKCIIFSKRFMWIYVTVFALSFGVPVHLLPERIDGNGRWQELYNESLGSPRFQKDVKPILEKILGGSWRLFTENSFHTSFYQEPGETMLYINGSMPEGCTVQQMNETIEQMENFITQFDEVDLFETSVSSYRNSSIRIHFKPEHERSRFPYILKSKLESKAIDLGGADWSVYGIGKGFSNVINDGYRSNEIVLDGYNYEQLYQFAERLKKELVLNSRVREVDILGSHSGGRGIIDEFFY